MENWENHMGNEYSHMVSTFISSKYLTLQKICCYKYNQILANVEGFQKIYTFSIKNGK